MNEDGTVYLKSQFIPHGGNINSLQFGSTASKCLLSTCGYDRKCKIWEVSKPNQPALNTFELNSIGSGIGFNKDDDIVVTGLQNGSIKIWDMETGQTNRTLPGHRAEVCCVEYYEYHNTNYLASGSFATDIKLWDIRKRGAIFSYSGHSGPIKVIRFSPDGKFMVSGSVDKTFRIWDLRNGKNLVEKNEPAGRINDIRFHPTEMIFAVGSEDRSVYFYDFETFELISTAEKTTSAIEKIRFSFEGNSLYSQSGEVIKHIKWEPFTQINAFHTPHGNPGDFILNQNKIITAGIKDKSKVSLHVIDLSLKATPKRDFRRGPINQSTPKDTKKSIQGGNNELSIKTDISIAAKDPFKPSDKIMHSPMIPVIDTNPPKQSIRAIPSNPIRKKQPQKIQNIQHKKENDIPLEIFVAPTPRQNNQPVVLENQPRSQPVSSRPLAMVKPNNSFNADNNPIANISPKVVDPVKIGAEQKNSTTMNLLSILSASPVVLKQLRSRYDQHSFIKTDWMKGNIVGSLRTACRDRGVLCDLVKVLLDQPSAWNLEIAVEGTQSANLLAQSKHKNHLGVASKVIKFVLTQFNEIIREHNDRSTMNGFIGVDVNAERRQTHCRDIMRLASDARNTFEERKSDDKNEQFSTTLREINLLIISLQPL